MAAAWAAACVAICSTLLLLVVLGELGVVARRFVALKLREFGFWVLAGQMLICMPGMLMCWTPEKSLMGDEEAM